ncbi:integrase core domain-containing protein [Jannaschia rubra]|uniref:integrase core domain-containing protein n=1 Tax=Jannaschia rubra TaxID=282197 RepID=UPI0011605346
MRFSCPWNSADQVKWETSKWVDQYNKTRFHSAIRYVTPKEAEEAFHASLNAAKKSSLIIELETLP